MTDTRIGLIVPPLAGAVPRDAADVYPGVPFLAEGLGLREMSVAGYDSVISAVRGASERLAARGAEAVVLMGTSLSFYRGKDFNDEIVDTMRQATGLPVTTMSAAIVDALRAVGVARPAVASAYTAEVHGRLLRFLAQEGLDVAGSAHLSISSIDEVHTVDDDTVHDLAVQAAEDPGFDGILISCGGLQTARAVTALEESYGVPVVSSPLAGLWAAVRLVRPEVAGTHGSRLFRVPA
ncbi:aspartate/glutamate racemase family protein [Microbacterium resistens]|uniref:Aspartate/glutamate racemase family protein n=1 Tax=Microbacterium resistens TaxID=156977 RepID=A0ABY3RP72_9MICO|nr:aspartate/glutamate racemase family protein [Microbacterium resistens]UGS25626.1 aspartate/glutamate racemase family protein [Microbacterium resistens]